MCFASVGRCCYCQFSRANAVGSARVGVESILRDERRAGARAHGWGRRASDSLPIARGPHRRRSLQRDPRLVLHCVLSHRIALHCKVTALSPSALSFLVHYAVFYSLLLYVTRHSVPLIWFLCLYLLPNYSTSCILQWKQPFELAIRRTSSIYATKYQTLNTKSNLEPDFRLRN